MAVRDQRPSSALLGGVTKAAALRALADREGHLSDLARRLSISKSALRAALARLVEAGVVELDETRVFRIRPEAREVVDGIVALDSVDPPRDIERSAMEDHRGEWAALDADQRVLAADCDPRALVRTIRERGLAPTRIMRIPEQGQRVTGAMGG
jgi:DNA-binding IclR family transcriptional regulator